ncbi:hybrid sensor histidine kinase/response regulator [Sandaracinus amylolyticus]|uniref:hybrid sensor histidine kinase/response regulator n=1 Tax=Sandaracinus amylolyticus TaxID=927083 RepID=UPI001F413912|nr:hybrid sensor histidine kinase/response regulator [Sandaracinus amylolyticus]UJR81320.1 Sensor histidine kinase [Sandaracinus amylolyticus]
MKVLLVEDSRTQARRFQSALERAGMRVMVRHDGAEGLRAALEDPPDVVVSDVLMPELDGWELCLALRDDPRTASLPIVLMTSLTDPDDVLRALAAGADGYVGKPFEDAVLVDRVQRVLAQRETPLASIEIHGRSLPIRASRETILGVLTCALEDAASRHAEVSASRERLEQAKGQQDEMIGVVAHELRTPLNVLSLRAGLEAAGHVTSSVSGRAPLPPLAELVARNVRAMSAIVDDLLDVARIESGAIRVTPRVGDLGALAREVASRFAVVSARHPVEVHVAESVEAVFDAARVEQVLANLLSNAIKYSPNGGRVDVRVSVDEGRALVEVEDEGIGVPEAAAERLFGRYVRAPGSERVAKGVGLGLYICRRLVDLQGGRIGVSRREPQGSRFWFTLPLAR